MDYSTELVNHLAQQVAAELRQSLARTDPGGGAPDLARLETGLRELMRQVGAQALGLYLSQAHGTPVSEMDCACGGRLKYQRRRTATVISVFGKVKYRRAYYADCVCGRGRAPLDAQLGIQPGGVSAGLADLLALAGVELAFEQAADWLEAFLLFRVSENTLRRETERKGQCQAAREAEVCRQSQDEDYLQERLRQVTERPERLYGSIDAARVRMEPRTTEADGEKWRDMKVGCWYEAEPVPPTQRSTRQREKYARDQSVYRARHQRYYCAMAEADAFGPLVWGTGCQARADLARELVFVCDGAPWIWNLVERYYPQAVQIVDWYHAENYLERVASAAWSDPALRVTWLQTVTEALWEGRVHTVIRRCEQLAPGCEEARTAVGYFRSHAHRMRYDHFRARGYSIGSGTVESACKQIVTRRLKRSGAQWTSPGAVRTAKARAVWLSGEWDALRAYHAQLPLAT